MCGFIGCIGRIDKSELIRMTRAITHRGPDDEGIFHIPGEIGLGFRRLSIIDLSEKGHQPMQSTDKRYTIVYNGEIYNFQQIRDELENLGYKFFSQADTEVVLNAFIHWREKAMDRFNGMFAFAVWDQKQKVLFAARDRYGQKPLYFSDQAGRFSICSELKSLLAAPWYNPKISAEALSYYLAYEYVPFNLSIFENTYKLLPGHYLEYRLDNKKHEIKPYWDFEFGEPDINYSIQDLGREIKTQILQSVEKRLISDVPLGIFLSGGIDSSIITWAATRILGENKLNTFSIGFEDKTFDESVYAKQVADLFKTNHHHKTMSPQVLMEIIPEVENKLDEPFADASIFPTYLLSKFTRQHVTVALGGDGGDELFCGYPPFQAHAVIPGIKIPSVLISPLKAMTSLIPVNDGNISLDFKIKQTVKGLDYRLYARNQVWLGAFTPSEQKKIMRNPPDILKNNFIYHDLEKICHKVKTRSKLDRISYLYLKTYLVEDILSKVDRASMMCSLEARAPFLDKNFTDLVAGIPVNFKYAKGAGKYILKKVFADELPEEILFRPKKGFGIPLARWFKGPLKKDLTAALQTEFMQSVFKINQIQGIMTEHQAGKKDNRKLLFTLYMFSKWQQHTNACL